VEKQYSQLQHYDAMIIADEDASDAEREELEEFLAADARIVRFTGVQFTKVTVASEDSNISAYVYAPENMDSFREDVTLRNRVTGEIYQMPEEGAAISEKTADLMDLEIGDDIVLEKDKDRKSTRLNSSHVSISYAVFCLKKKTCRAKSSSRPLMDTCTT